MSQELYTVDREGVLEIDWKDVLLVVRIDQKDGSKGCVIIGHLM